MSSKDIRKHLKGLGATTEEAQTIAKVCAEIGVTTMKDYQKLNAELGKRYGGKK